MKICMLTTSYPSETNPSRGIFIQQLAERLAFRKHDITVIAPRFSKKTKITEMHNGVKVKRVLFYNYKNIFNFAELRPWFIQDVVTIVTFFIAVMIEGAKIVSNKKIDIIHVHWVSVCGLAGIILGKVFNRPVVMSARGDDILVWPKFSKLLFYIIKWIADNADIVLSVTRNIYEELIEWGIKPEKIQISYRGVDINIFKPQKEDSELVTKYNLKGKQVILFIGDFTRNKNPDYLLEAFAKICYKKENTVLLFVGDGHLMKTLEERVNEIRIGGRVFFAGRVSHDKIPRYLSICDIFVLPSLSEAAGTASLEAMACKKPVIITETIGMAKPFIEAHAAVVVRCRDYDSLADGLLRLLEDEELQRQISENAYNYVINNHTWELEIETTERVYKALRECT